MWMLVKFKGFSFSAGQLASRVEDFIYTLSLGGKITTQPP